MFCYRGYTHFEAKVTFKVDVVSKNGLILQVIIS
jgi:hypothetical protein